MFPSPLYKDLIRIDGLATDDKFCFGDWPLSDLCELYDNALDYKLGSINIRGISQRFIGTFYNRTNADQTGELTQI